MTFLLGRWQTCFGMENRSPGRAYFIIQGKVADVILRTKMWMFPSPCCYTGPICSPLFHVSIQHLLSSGNFSKHYHQFFWECGNHPPESVSPLIAVGTSPPVCTVWMTPPLRLPKTVDAPDLYLARWESLDSWIFVASFERENTASHHRDKGEIHRYFFFFR